MRAYPQPSAGILHEGVGGVVGQPLVSGELLEGEVCGVGGVAHLVEPPAGRGEPHDACMVFEDVAYLEIAECAVGGVVVVVGLGVGCELRRMEDDDAVAATGEDEAGACLHQSRDVAHEGRVVEEFPELPGAVGLLCGEAQRTHVDGHPHPVVAVLKDVEHLPPGERVRVVGLVGVETPVDGQAAPARAHPLPTLGVAADGKHVVVHTDARLQQHVARQLVGAAHEIASPHLAVGGHAHHPEEVGIVGGGTAGGIMPPHPSGHGGDDAQPHILLRHPDVAGAVHHLAIEVVALDGRGGAVAWCEVGELARGGHV